MKYMSRKQAWASNQWGLNLLMFVSKKARLQRDKCETKTGDMPETVNELILLMVQKSVVTSGCW